MRDYGKVYPRFWTGGTGKNLRGDMEAQILALYLMTCPHANMIGVFHCPVMYMSHETGMTLEGASRALQRLIEAGFCTFDGDDDVVFVHEMASHQIGVLNSPRDKQVLGLRKQVDQIAQTRIRAEFRARYEKDFHLIFDDENTSPSEAPSKTPRSQEQEQEHDIKPSSPDKPDDGFVVFWKTYPKKVGKGAAMKAWKKVREPAATLNTILEALTWQIASEQWVKDGGQFIPHPSTYLNEQRWMDEKPDVAALGKPWYVTASGIEHRARELGVEKGRDEPFPSFKFRVYQVAGVTEQMLQQANSR